MWEDFPDAEEDQAPDSTVEISAAKRSGADPWADFPDAEPKKDDEWAAFPDAEGGGKSTQSGAFARGFAESVLPSAAGIAVGLPVGGAATLGSAPVVGPAAPLVGIAAGMGAGGAASYAVAKAQDAFLRWLGIREGEGAFSDVQRRADREEYPLTELAGSLAPNVAAFGTGIGKGLSLAARGFGGGLQGAVEAAQEYATEGHVDWKKALMAGAFGTVWAAPRKYIQPLDPLSRPRPAAPEATPPVERAQQPPVQSTEQPLQHAKGMPASTEIADRIRRQTYDRPDMFEDPAAPPARKIDEPDIDTMYPETGPWGQKMDADFPKFRPGRPDEAGPAAPEIKAEATVPPAPVAQGLGIAAEHAPAPKRNVGNEVGAPMAARETTPQNYAKGAEPAPTPAVEHVQVVPQEVSAAVKQAPIKKPIASADDAFAAMKAREQEVRPPDAKEVTATVTPDQQAIIDQALARLKVSPRDMEAIKAKLETFPPEERLAGVQRFLDDIARGEVAAKRPRVTGPGVTKDIQARDKADAAKKSAVAQLAHDTMEHFSVEKYPLDPKAGIKEIRNFANRIYKTAVMANKGVDPLTTYKASEGFSPATDWLYAARQVVRAPTPDNIHAFVTAHYLRGDVGTNVDRNMKLAKRPDVETVGRAAESEGRSTYPEFFDAGESATVAAQHNKLRDWVNKLSDEDYARLQGVYGAKDLNSTIRGANQPNKTLEALKSDLAEAQMANRPSGGAFVYEGVNKKVTPVKGKEDLKSTGRSLDLTTPEGKAAAASVAIPQGGPRTKKEIKAAKESGLAQLQMKARMFASDESGSVGGTPGANQPIFNRAPKTVGPYDQEGFLKAWHVPILRSLRNLDRYAYAADPLFGGPEKNPFRKYSQAVMRGEARARELHQESAKLLEPIAEAKRVTPDEFAKVQKLVFEETWWQRWADRDLNSQGFSTTGRTNKRANAAHADLEAQYNALTPEMKDLRTQMHEFFRTRNEMISEQLGANRLLKEAGLTDPALVKRIIDGKETAADRRLLGPTARQQDAVLESIREVSDVTQLKGPFVPLAHGEGPWITFGLRKIVDPTDGKKLGPKDFEFTDPAKAEAFAEKQDGMQTSIREYTVDPATGERYYKETVDGVEKEFAYKKGDETPTGGPTEQRYAVHVENGHLRAFRSARRANAYERELRQSGEYEDKSTYYEPRKNTGVAGSRLANDLSETAMSRLSNSALYSGMSDQQKSVVRQAITEAVMQKMAATKAYSSRLQRRTVGGYEEDLARAVHLYGNDTANRIATLETRPTVEAAMAEAEAMIQAARKDTPDKAAAMRDVHNEFDRRYKSLGPDGDLSAAKMSPAMQRVLSTVYMMKLATPAYSITNMTQPSLVTYPMLGGEYGYSAAGKAMVQAYKDLGVVKAIGTGFRNTGRAIKGETPDTIVENFKARLTDKNERALMDRLVQENVMSPDAGFPVERAMSHPDGVEIDIGHKTTKLHDAADSALTALDRTHRWAEEVTRAMPQAVEAVNRGVSGLTTFRLELAKNGGNVEKAMQKAVEITSKTQIAYSDLLKAPALRHNFMRFPLQFKQFGMGMAENFGEQITRAVQNRNPGDREAALKTLAGLAVSHGAVAGLLGLPGWELVKAFLIGAKTAGLTNTDYEDLENGARKKMADVMSAFGGQQFGKASAEAIMKGMPRLLGFDMSSRVGLDNMLLFGAPRSGSETDLTTNLQAWLFNLAGGAPATSLLQMAEGLRDVMSGDLEKGLAKAVPLKIASDAIKAYQGVTEGKRDKRGRETLAPYSYPEAGMRLLGLTPAREAETSKFRSVVYGKGKEGSEQQSKLIGAWIKASPDQKGKAFSAAINAGIPPATMMQALRRHQLEQRRTVHGIVTTKRTAPIARELGEVYNLR